MNQETLEKVVEVLAEKVRELENKVLYRDMELKGAHETQEVYRKRWEEEAEEKENLTSRIIELEEAIEFKEHKNEDN